jgi:hypothetical protein
MVNFNGKLKIEKVFNDLRMGVHKERNREFTDDQLFKIRALVFLCWVLLSQT